MQNRWPSEIRLVAFGVAFVALSWVVVWRLAQLQIERHDHYEERARGQQYKRIVIQPERGEILDMKGRVLATSIGRLSVYVDPRHLPGDAQLWAGLFAETLELPYTHVLPLLKKDHPVPLARQLDPQRAYQVLPICDEFNLRENALWFHRETERVYPRSTGAHLIGFCSTDGDGDNEGIASLEMTYDSYLDGQKITKRVERSAIRTILSPIEDALFREAKGDTLVLTIDAVLQETAEQALATQAEQFRADAGVIIVQEAKTGAIRAMASYPSYDNNRFYEATASERRNRCLTDPIEPGSVAKVFTMATLFDLNLHGPNDLVDCHGGYLGIHGRRVIDAPGHTLHIAPLRDVFRWSSNVGTVVAAQALSPEQYYEVLRRFGFGQQTGIDLPGEGEGLLRHVSRWTRMTMSSIPMGYEIALTPIQISTAVSGILNDGRMMRPYVVAERRNSRGGVIWRAEPQLIREIVRPSTSALMRELLEEVVVDGTGKKAQIPNYRTGGKTGTTRKSQVLDRREYISSFVGAVPIDDPELTIFCSIDNPKGEYYASSVAAPLFQEVASAALAQLAIRPTTPPHLSIASHHGEEGGYEYTGFYRSDSAPAETAAASTPQRLETAHGQMPDLTGLTMSEARRTLRGVDLDVRFVGTGRVVDQNPPAGAPAPAGARAIVVFRDSAALDAVPSTEGSDEQADEPAEQTATEEQANAWDGENPALAAGPH